MKRNLCVFWVSKTRGDPPAIMVSLWLNVGTILLQIVRASREFLSQRLRARCFLQERCPHSDGRCKSSRDVRRCGASRSWKSHVSRWVGCLLWPWGVSFGKLVQKWCPHRNEWFWQDSVCTLKWIELTTLLRGASFLVKHVSHKFIIVDEWTDRLGWNRQLKERRICDVASGPRD